MTRSPVDIARERIASALQLVDLPTRIALLDEARRLYGVASRSAVVQRATPYEHEATTAPLDEWRPDVAGGSR